MTHMAAHFLECRFVEQGVEPVARRHQPLGAALGELFRPSAVEDLRLAPPHVLKQIGEGHSVTLHVLAAHGRKADGELRSGLAAAPAGVRLADDPVVSDRFGIPAVVLQ